MAASFWELVKGARPVASMVLVQIILAGVNLFYKLAASDGMNLSVLVAYRNILALGFLAPLALFLERKERPRLTWKILIQSFFCGIFGGTLTQNLYVEAIKLTTATFTATMANLSPAITFILAIFVGLEKLEIKTLAGKAKVGGTLLGMGGAMLLTLYKGPEIVIWTSKINLLRQHSEHGQAHDLEPGNRVKGALTAVSSVFCYSIWLILQAKLSKNYPVVYSSTALMCAMAAIQSTLYALCLQMNWSEWRLGLNIRLITVVYVGVIASGATLTLMSWCIRLKGPLFASVFNPLLLVIVSILGSILLDEKLHLGSILGAGLIVGGLYLVLLMGKDASKQGGDHQLPLSTSSPCPHEEEMEIDTCLKSRRLDDGLVGGPTTSQRDGSTV